MIYALCSFTESSHVCVTITVAWGAWQFWNRISSIDTKGLRMDSSRVCCMSILFIAFRMSRPVVWNPFYCGLFLTHTHTCTQLDTDWKRLGCLSQVPSVATAPAIAPLSKTKTEITLLNTACVQLVQPTDSIVRNWLMTSKTVLRSVVPVLH